MTRRLASRLELHFTPKHGSWLNVAESELAVVSMQCLGRRIPATDVPHRETAAPASSSTASTRKFDLMLH